MAVLLAQLNHAGPTIKRARVTAVPIGSADRLRAVQTSNT